MNRIILITTCTGCCIAVMEYMIIVDGLYAVGMHHWGSSRLQVGAAYKLRREPENRWDSNAIAVYDGSRRVAYLARAYALRLTRVLDVADPTTAIYLKPKAEPEVVSRREGPRQRSTIGFKIRRETAHVVCQAVLNNGLLLRQWCNVTISFWVSTQILNHLVSRLPIVLINWINCIW